MNAPTATATLQSLQVANRPPAANLPAVRMGFDTAAGFDLLNRVAKAFASSDLVPQQYRGNVANCIVATEMASRMGASPLLVMQNLYLVHGNPGWSAKFLIATVNTCGRFRSLQYEWRGEEGKKSRACRAWTIEKETGTRLEGVWIDWKMVEDEGWSKKKDSKWLTMPDQMFIYRSSSFWTRAYAPELSMGLMTEDELHDTFDLQADGSYTITTEALKNVTVPASAADVIGPPADEPKEPAVPLLDRMSAAKTMAELDAIAADIPSLDDEAFDIANKAYDMERARVAGEAR